MAGEIVRGLEPGVRHGVTLNDRERRAIVRVLHNANPNEDLIGQLLYFGAAEELVEASVAQDEKGLYRMVRNEDGLVRLAAKLEGGPFDPVGTKVRVAFIGSRAWTDEDIIVNRLLSLPAGAVVVVSDAPGAEAIVRQLCHDMGITLVVIGGSWERDAHRDLIAGCDRMEAFATNGSVGTADAVSLAIQLGKPVFVSQVAR